ncbi:hypothetical protein J7L00_00660 [Candidatus Bathyarchaeota archaeon]|nr:hypothetical protein [Candidatus Bathyarchaeota archaeon]
MNQTCKDIRCTFVDNMKAPIHRWYRYPCGFSYTLVEECFKHFNVKRGDLVLDPFVGCGTTSVCAKLAGIDSIGVEAHPYVAWIAEVKTYWDFDIAELRKAINDLCMELWEKLLNINESDYDLDSKPEFLLKNFSRRTLCELYAIKDAIEERDDIHFRDFCLLALAGILRKVSSSSVVFPYMLPRKRKKNKIPNTLEAFNAQIAMMLDDLQTILKKCSSPGEAKIVKGDSTKKIDFIDDNMIDFAFTSPPYLNNVDYADATRLDLYFFGIASSWREITLKVRNKLMTSSTTQVNGKRLGEELLPREELPQEIRDELTQIARKLRREKYRRSGRKDYDIVCIAYFNEMYSHMTEMFRCLRPGGYYLLVLGDSAPYGVHIPTDILLAKVALSVGFKEAKLQVLRKRGDKWKSIAGGRRHDIPLRESLIILKK